MSKLKKKTKGVYFFLLSYCLLCFHDCSFQFFLPFTLHEYTKKKKKLFL